MHSLNNRGDWVQINKKNETACSGWLIGETPEAVYLTDGEDDKRTQVVWKSEYNSISYDHDNTNDILSVPHSDDLIDRMHSSNQTLQKPLRRALSRLRYDRLFDAGLVIADNRSFHKRSKRLERKFRRNPFRDSEALDLVLFSEARIDRSIELHAEVFDVFNDAGLTEVLDEYGDLITGLPAELAIPLDDLRFSDRDELIKSHNSASEAPWSISHHVSELDQARQIRVRMAGKINTRLLGQKSTEEIDKKDREPEQKERGSDRDGTFASRWIGPSLRILAGTGLASANCALGLTAGLTSTIATIGLTSVPTYVGVATSIYTGMTQVADGLEKINRA